MQVLMLLPFAAPMNEMQRKTFDRTAAAAAQQSHDHVVVG
jgi:hypothetical protein